MRDRLIELIMKARAPLISRPQAEKEADYLLANGVVCLPCKCGTVVYVLRSQTSNGKNLYLREERIDHYRTFDKRTFMIFESGRLSVDNEKWNDTVFLTKEEAERALKNNKGE